MTFVESGLRYCLTHHGIVETDEDAPCDFADGDPTACALTPLLYQNKPGRRGNPEGCQSRLVGRWGVHAKCSLPAGHDGDEHTNGHRRWTGQP